MRSNYCYKLYSIRHLKQILLLSQADPFQTLHDISIFNTSFCFIQLFVNYLIQLRFKLIRAILNSTELSLRGAIAPTPTVAKFQNKIEIKLLNKRRYLNGNALHVKYHLL